MSGKNSRMTLLARERAGRSAAPARYLDTTKSKSVPQGALTTSQATKQREAARAAARLRAAAYRKAP